MPPKLIVIAGPAEGLTFELAQMPVSLGRELDNRVCLADISVSRHHCFINEQEGQLWLHDLGSRNATYANGLPVKEHQLNNGDRIRLGDSLLLFLLDSEKAAENALAVQLNDNRIETKNTVLLRRSETAQTETLAEAVLSKPYLNSREAEELNALLKLSTTIYAMRNATTLCQHVLQALGAIIPAERGVIALFEEGGEEPVAITGWQRRGDAGHPLQLSRTVIRKVLREGVALLSNEIDVDNALRRADSILLAQISALLAAPLVTGERTVGVIYLDALLPGVQFDQDHLELLRAIANMTAAALENLRRVDELQIENQRLRAEISLDQDIVGQGPKMREVYQFIRKAAPSDATVLIRGESGTGKELAARALHNHGPRAPHPFVAINCAALTESLLESELFGYEKGAFTGAHAQKKGKIEVAQGGTLFLDEIGEMALNLQAKLLRVLQEREFERVGGTKSIKADIRVIAASNRELEQAIKDGRFREDLFYRLNVITLKLPPLRERREDIKLLANHFAGKYAQKCKRTIKGFAPGALACLQAYDWPGNVREFENTIERAIVLGSSEWITVEDLPEALISAKPQAAPTTATPATTRNFYDAVNEAKKQLILNAVAQAKGNYTEAARLLEVHPNHLHRLIRNLDMKGELLKFH